MNEWAEKDLMKLFTTHGKREGDMITIKIIGELDDLLEAIDNYYESISEQE
jgi:hypothetical protein